MRVGMGLAALALVAACSDAPTGPTASVRVDLSSGWQRASPGEVGMNALATTEWRALSDIEVDQLSAQVLGVIVGDVIPAAR